MSYFFLSITVCFKIYILFSASLFEFLKFRNYLKEILEHQFFFRLHDPVGNFKNVHATIDAIDRCKYGGGSGIFYKPLVTDKIIKVLRQGLNRRATNVVPLFVEQPATIELGIVLDPAEAFRVIEKGPIANTPEALEFRSFWGDFSECRR